MTLLPSGVKIHVTLGITDKWKGRDGLAMLVQGTLKQDPYSCRRWACGKAIQDASAEGTPSCTSHTASPAIMPS